MVLPFGGETAMLPEAKAGAGQNLDWSSVSAARAFYPARTSYH